MKRRPYLKNITFFLTIFLFLTIPISSSVLENPDNSENVISSSLAKKSQEMACSGALNSDFFSGKNKFFFEKIPPIVSPSLENTFTLEINNKIKKEKIKDSNNLEKMNYPKMLHQKELGENEISQILRENRDYKKGYEHVTERGYDSVEQVIKVEYEDGSKGIISLFSSKDGELISLVSPDPTSSTENIIKPFLMKLEEKEGEVILVISDLDNESGGSINLNKNEIVSVWGHGSCTWIRCVVYGIEYALASDPLLPILCGTLCRPCTTLLEPTSCGFCLTCLAGAGAGISIACTTPTPSYPIYCAYYPCQYDCIDINWESDWSYYCNGDYRFKHKWYTAYKCSSEWPMEGDCTNDQENTGWVQNTYEETCQYGCDESTNNCYGAITCSGDGDCGDSGWEGSPYCSGGDVWQYWKEYTCYNPGTESSYCGYDTGPIEKQECTSGICEYGECAGDVYCEDPGYPWACNDQCWHCTLGDDDYSICCPDSGDPEWCCHEDGAYCDTNTGDCDVCGGEYPYDCHTSDGDCWHCDTGELCCAEEYGDRDPENMYCCDTAGGSVCMADGDCCSPSLETCNNQDDNCDGIIDNFSEGCGTGICAGGIRTCTAGSWGACSTSGNAVNETCNNIDDDCNGEVDNNLTQECGTDVGECIKGTQTCTIGQWGNCTGNYIEPVNETCDGLDNNCNNIIDESNVCGDYPNATLLFPTNNYVSDTGNITFNCTAEDNVNLANITFYSNINGTFLANGTKTITGPNNSTTKTINNISIGNYIWNYLVYDNDSHWSWAWNGPFSFSVTVPGLINTFSDGNAEETLEYNQTGNQTVYIKIKKNANVTSAKLNLTGLPL